MYIVYMFFIKYKSQWLFGYLHDQLLYSVFRYNPMSSTLEEFWRYQRSNQNQ